MSAVRNPTYANADFALISNVLLSVLTEQFAIIALVPVGVANLARPLRPMLLRGLAVAIVCSYLALLTVAWWLNASAGYDGVLRPEPHEVGAGRGFTVLEVEPGSPADRAGIGAGDFVAAVDGNPFVFDVHQTYHDRRAGTAGSLRIEHGASSLVTGLTLESRLASPGIVLRLALASLLGIAVISIGAGVVFIRPAHAPAWLLFAFAVALAINTSGDLWHWSQQRAERAVLLDWVTGGAFVLGAAALVHLLVIFPAPGRIYAALRGKIWLLYVAALAPSAVIPFSGGSAVPAMLGTVAMLVAALFALEFSYRHPRTPLARAQLGWIRWGLGIGISATVLDKLALLAVPNMLPAAVNTVVDAAWLTLPVSLAFAVLRYRLFEVPRIVRATITWGILAAIILAVYLALVVLGGRFAAAALGPNTGPDPTVAILAALVVAGLVHPLRVRLQRALEHHVYHQRFARGRVMEQAAEFMVRPRAPAALTRYLCSDVPQVLGLSRGWLAVIADHAAHFEVEPAVFLPNVSLAASALIESLQSVAGPILLARPEDLDAYEAIPALSAEVAGGAAWYAAGARALVPLRSMDSSTLAIWVLGAPVSGDLFEREDLAALERIAAQAVMQLERDLARGQVSFAPASALIETDVLTPREQQVFQLLARGYSNRQIADELIIGVRTAETHVERILGKLSLENRAQAIIWAHEHVARVSGRPP